MAMTFLAVMFAWVPFRAETWDATLAMWQAMFGLSGVRLLDGAPLSTLATITAEPAMAAAVLALLTGFVWLLPNTQDWLSHGIGSGEGSGGLLKGIQKRLAWRPTYRWAVFNAATAVTALAFMIGRPDAQEFLYFQF
jgi:hypothetical protein